MKAAMSKEGAQDFVTRQRGIMESESPFRRKFIMISATVFSVLSLAVSLFWLIRADSANTMDEDIKMIEETTGDIIETHAFDLCAGFADIDVQDWHDICGTEGCTTDLHEVDTNWHTIFEYNGVVMIFTTFSFIIVAIGACSVYARIIGAFCATFWNLSLIHI